MAELPNNKDLFCVYIHTSPSGKMYIGQTNNYKKRCNSHRNTKDSPMFANAIKKYGWDNFTHKIIEDNLDIDTANELEAFLIEECNTLSPNGYNLHTGGNNGRPCIETIEKLAASRRGKPLSIETRKKISESNKGRVFSEETKKKISESNKGKIRTEETCIKIGLSKLGITHSTESKFKRSIASKGDSNPFYGKTHSEETMVKIKQTWADKRLPYDELPNTIEEALERKLKIVKQIIPCKRNHPLYGRYLKTNGKLGNCYQCIHDNKINNLIKQKENNYGITR